MKNKFYLKSLDKIKEGKLAEAVLFLDKAIEEEPENPIYYSERGVCYLNLNQLGRALEDMNQSVKLEPNYSYRYASRAFVKDKMGDTKGGIADYEIAIKLDPEDAIAYNNLGLLQEKLGYEDYSKKSFKKADELADKNPLPSISPTHTSEKTTLPPISPTQEKKESLGSIFNKIITDKETRQDFWKFIKNGFKIK